MQYLKKNTIKAFFLFARASEERDLNNRVDETLPGVLFDSPAKRNAYLEFLDGLTQGERAEMTGLYLLGTDHVRSLVDWEAKVKFLLKNPSDELEHANPLRIPQIIRNGLEKLARLKKAPLTSLKTAPLPKPPSINEPMDLIHKIAGKFTLEAYQEKYGELDGMKRLLTIMEIKGYLNDPTDRTTLGLPALATRMPLEMIHQAKK